MSIRSFGARPPYSTDFELSNDLAPDPFSEEPLPRATTHRIRPAGQSLRSDRVKIQRKEENS